MFTDTFETIVVGVDFSPYSKIVVKQALKLAALWKAKLVFVHAYNEPFEYAPSLYISTRKPLSSTHYIDRIKKTYGLKNISAKFVAEYSIPAQLIISTAKKSKRPLVVAGYKGNRQWIEAFFGSTAQRLALKSKLPVWIHRGNKIISPKRVLIPHDLSKQSNRSIDLIKKLKLISPIEYQVFFVRGKPFPVLDYQLYKKMEQENVARAQKKIRLLLAKYPRLPLLSTTGDITEKIVEKTKEFDLIMMSHHAKTYFAASETRQLMKESQVPIMVV